MDDNSTVIVMVEYSEKGPKPCHTHTVLSNLILVSRSPCSSVCAQCSILSLLVKSVFRLVKMRSIQSSNILFLEKISIKTSKSQISPFLSSGWLYDVTGSYFFSFWMGGASVLVSSLVLIPTVSLDICSRCRERPVYANDATAAVTMLQADV